MTNITKIANQLPQKEIKLLLPGLSNTGKTTILHNIKLNETILKIPTIKFDIDTVKYGNLSLRSWDLERQGKIRLLWRYYHQNTNGIIFVVDNNNNLDPNRIKLTKNELYYILTEKELSKIPLLILANKQDLPNTMHSSEIIDKFELNKIKDRLWYIQECCAITSEGLEEGFKWLFRLI